ncbi:MAG: S-methyl-5-thioribose-1-phosphate isomerase [Acidilobaceae archaeon]|nr:S-methyl-5-thioribose-1-phosphate isomerase [Acidilobaceae archaeon]MCX8165030.1 S-methyl-5-thioribose-1-phosphate isomerase [Acidilobaceae archaeon]MDW7974453.1 S-methyl-5-thioribose-1-phosphate isomerase [Sulfolobales archaeon]
MNSELAKLERFLKIRPLYFDEETKEFIWLDTRLLPFEEVYRRTRDYRRVAEAIRSLEIRGAPAIGVSAAFGMALAALESKARSVEELLRELEEAKRVLASTRPTAYNLFWALDRVMGRASRDALSGDPGKVSEGVVDEAMKIYVEDVKTNVEIGRIGSKLIENGSRVLTHCNTGALATAGFGTALGIVRYAWYEGKSVEVITTETRPVLQGARLNVWELKKEGIPFKLIVDSAVAIVMKRGLVDLAIVGADRIVLTGHVANKIGTLQVALAANYAGKPFYVAAPTSTVQRSWDAESIVIEERGKDEVITVMGRAQLTLKDIEVYNPAFDVTPPELISGIVTERGIATKPYSESLPKLLS